MAARVVVTQPLVGDAIERLRDAGATVELLSNDGPPTHDALCAAVVGARGLVCLLTDRVDASVLAAGAPTLGIVANVAVGVDNVDVAAATRAGVFVANTPGVLDAATADLAIGLLIAAARRVVTGMDLIRDGQWTGLTLGAGLGRDLAGLRLGLIGYGRIARKVAARAAAFEMVVIHHARHDTGLDGHVASLDELLGAVDAVSLHVPLTDETRGLLGDRELRRLPHGALVVNTARGAVLDEGALAAALHEGRLAGAGLDVFEREPHVHPALLTAPNVVLTPHIGSATVETRAAMAAMAVAAVAELLATGSVVAAPLVNRNTGARR